MPRPVVSAMRRSRYTNETNIEVVQVVFSHAPARRQALLVRLYETLLLSRACAAEGIVRRIAKHNEDRPRTFHICGKVALGFQLWKRQMRLGRGRSPARERVSKVDRCPL